jgi:hypothetical protein
MDAAREQEGGNDPLTFLWKIKENGTKRQFFWTPSPLVLRII